MFKTCRASRESVILCLALVLTLLALPVYGQNSTAPTKPADLIKALQYRSIGPYRGGRSAAVAGVPSQPFVYYYGATGGGVWKTTDGGINWEPISDGSVFGNGSGLKTRDRSRAFAFIRRTPIWFTSPRWAMFGVRTTNAESFVPKTVARR